MAVRGITGKRHKLMLLEPNGIGQGIIQGVTHEVIVSAHGSQEYVHTCIRTVCTSTQVAAGGPLICYFTGLSGFGSGSSGEALTMITR